MKNIYYWKLITVLTVFFISTLHGYSQANDLDFGDAPAGYPTTLAGNGARHTIVPGIYLGSGVDAEPDGLPSVNADGDDLDNLDDEDGVIMPAYITKGTTVTIGVIASVDGYLDAWLDFSRSNGWADAGEHIFTSAHLVAGSNILTFSVPVNAASGLTYVRFRFRTNPASITYTGLAADGEVEDYAVTIEDPPAEDMDFGDAPEGMNGYPTTLASNGARHIIVPGIWLGDGVDFEPDGQPGPNADCDDNDCEFPSFGDDEDGVSIPSVLTRGAVVYIAVSASVSGYLDGWMDFNHLNGWSDTGEHIFENVPLTAGPNNLSFSIPANAATGKTYLRFRFRDYPGTISFDGLVMNGETEDYAVSVVAQPNGNTDFGDAPEGTNGYQTALANNGARHIIVPGVFLGTSVDPEPDGQPGINADCDDNDCLQPSGGDDENGVVMPAYIDKGSTISIGVVASVNGYLDGWIDFNRTNGWADAGEHIFVNQPLVAGSNTITFSVPSNAYVGQTYARFRFRTTPASISYTGLVANGEVEDYTVTIEDAQGQNYDFGDAPEGNPGYPTTLINNGARHLVVPGVYLGTAIDAEPDGLPSSGADGDDMNGTDDEDGVTFLWPVSAGSPCKIKVNASVGDGLLNVWIDFNHNGSWADAGDQIFADKSLVAGDNYLTFIVPPDASQGATYARFRFSHEAGLSFDGFASDGEVEDYKIESAGLGQIKWQQLPEQMLAGLPAHDDNRIADDWICNGGLVTGISWWGNYEMNGSSEKRGSGISQFLITFYSGSSCKPENLLQSFTVPFGSITEVSTGMINISASPVYLYSFDLPQPFEQVQGNGYWISIRAISNVPSSPAAWRWQEANRWFYPISCGTVSFNQASGWQTLMWPTPVPGQYSDMAFSVISANRLLNLKVFLEGLYDPSSGMMHEAMDITGPKWGAGVADKITVEFHDAANYGNIAYSAVTSLSTAGAASLLVPVIYNGSYNLTIRNRNSIETTSAAPVSLTGGVINYDFSTAASQAFGANQHNFSGVYAIWGGDVNQDGIVDGGDMNPVDNASTAITFGYVAEDVNGDGIVDGGDMNIVDNNSTAIIMAVTP
jgi:hypothetical protein